MLVKRGEEFSSAAEGEIHSQLAAGASRSMATHRSREAFVSRCFAQRYEASQPAVVIRRCAEPLQVVRYNVGEYYREHFDNKEGATVIKRAATLIM